MIVKIRNFKSPKANRYRQPQSPAAQTWTLKGGVKANSRYIAHRSGKDGEKMSRELFGHDGQLTKDQVYDMIDGTGKGTYFFKLVISSDPRKEDFDKQLNLREITLKTIAEFEATTNLQVQFFAAIHNADHTPIRHVHAVVLVPGRVSRDVFKALPGNLVHAARAEAYSQRQQLGLGVEKGPAIPHTQQPPLTAQVRLPGGKPSSVKEMLPRCPLCGMPMVGQGTCVSCGFSLEFEPHFKGVGRGW